MNSWGYEIREGVITIHDLALLERSAWAGDLDLLRAQFPSWTFEDEA